MGFLGKRKKKKPWKLFRYCTWVPFQLMCQMWTFLPLYLFHLMCFSPFSRSAAALFSSCAQVNWYLIQRITSYAHAVKVHVSLPSLFCLRIPHASFTIRARAVPESAPTLPKTAGHDHSHWPKLFVFSSLFISCGSIPVCPPFHHRRRCCCCHWLKAWVIATGTRAIHFHLTPRESSPCATLRSLSG